MPQNTEDLRHEKRIAGKHSILVCYPSQDGSDKKEKHTCKAGDISEGGLKIVTRRPLPLGCFLPIEIQVADMEKRFNFSGEVKWCLEIDETPTYFAGIKLIKIDKENYQAWRELANES